MELKVETFTHTVPTDEFIRDFVDVPRFLECCSQCPGYGRTWACPPYDFDPTDLWKSSSSVLLAVKRVLLPEEATERTYSYDELKRLWRELLKPAKDELKDLVLSIEAENPGSTALFAGGCDVCEACSRGEGRPCVRPEAMRYSVESIGGDVMKSLKAFFGLEAEWAENGRLPKQYLLMGGVLLP